MKRKLLSLSFLLWLNCFFSQITMISTGTSEHIFNISMLDPNNVLINGKYNYLSRSFDQCNSDLIGVNSPVPANYVSYLDRKNLTAAYMLAGSFGVYNYKIYKSTDDGNAWNLLLDTNAFVIDFLRFFDADEGYAVSTFNKALRLKNGGATRISAWSPNTITTAIEVFGDSMLCLGGTNGGGGICGLSKDRGHTWFGGYGLDQQSTPSDFFFLSKDTIVGVAINGIGGPVFFKTLNRGASWQKKYLGPCNPKGVFFKNAAEGYVLGYSAGKGMILKTTDLGQTWTTFNTEIATQLLDMKFLNDSIALVSGTSGVLFKWNSKTSVFTGAKTNSLAEFNLKVFPNPVNKKLLVDLTGIPINGLKVSLTNILGQLVYSNKVFGETLEIDTEDLGAGLYVLRIQNETGNKAIKIVKE